MVSIKTVISNFVFVSGFAESGSGYGEAERERERHGEQAPVSLVFIQSVTISFKTIDRCSQLLLGMLLKHPPLTC